MSLEGIAINNTTRQDKQRKKMTKQQLRPK